MQIKLSRSRLIVLGLLPLAVAAWLLWDWVVVTDAERIEAKLESLARAVEKNDVEAVMPYLDKGFRIDRMNREQFHVWYGLILKVISIKKVGRGRTTVEMDRSDEDLALVTVHSTIETNRAVGIHRIIWDLEFRRRAEDDWKLWNVRARRPHNDQEITLQDIGRAAMP